MFELVDLLLSGKDQSQADQPYSLAAKITPCKYKCGGGVNPTVLGTEVTLPLLSLINVESFSFPA